MRTIVKALAMTALAATVPAQAAFINTSFTAAEGFEEGPLNNHQDWWADTWGSSDDWWTVDPSGSGKITVAHEWHRAFYREALNLASGETLKLRTEFKLLGENQQKPTGNTPILVLGFSAHEDAAAPAADVQNMVIQFSAWESGYLQLRGWNNEDTVTVLGTIEDHGSANLAVEYALNVGDSAAGSTIDMKFINMDTGDSGTGSQELQGNIYTALTEGDGVYPYLQVYQFDNNESGVTGVEVFSIREVPPPSGTVMFMR